uniref:RRM domain-containing protein n=2 Tax=Triticum aestivum TaxID=4565 RepID=A0A3B6TGD9_WHEAT
MAVEDLGEVEREEATGAESVEEEPDEEEPEEEDPEESEEDPDAEDDPEDVEEDPEDVEEDPEDAEEEADAVEDDEEDTVLAAGPEKTVTVEGGDEEKAMVTVSKEGGGEVTGLESAMVEEPEEAANVDAMEEDATEVPGDGAAPDDMNELSEEEHEESGHEGTHGNNEEDGVACQLSVHSEAQNGELDSSLPTLGSVSVGNTKDLQVFLHGLPKDCAEKDITEVFSQFGEIESIKTIRKKNGIAFVRYMSTEAAKKALAEFKEGAEVTGGRVKVLASRGDNTLYLSNICKSWTKEQVRTSLRSIGIDGFDMSLPVDPETGGQNRGITFLKFASPDNAKAASQLLQQPDALITIVKSVKESAQIPTESSQELAMLQVKTVYLEHVPLSWDKGKVKECCKAYGVILDVHILKKSKTKTSFVEFSSRKSALACVEGINSANIGGEVKLAASLARPRREMQLDKKSAKGGVKVNSDATSKDTNNSIKKKNQNREVRVKKDSPHKLRKGDVSKLTSHVDAEVPQSSNPSKGKRKAGKTENTAVNERAPKRARKNRGVLTKPSNRTSHGGYARVPYAGESSGNIKRPVGPRYVTGNQSYPIAGASSRSKPNARDLEPHAGYIPPTNRVRAPANHVPVTYVYDHPRSAPSTIHHIDGLPYAREVAAPPPAYGYTSNPQYQDGYAYAYLPPPHPSVSYHYPGTGAYSPRRRYY